VKEIFFDLVNQEPLMGCLMDVNLPGAYWEEEVSG
jgi:hypothetical protein